MDVLAEHNAAAASRKFNPPRLKLIRELLEANANPVRASKLREFHKSHRRYFGLKDFQLMEVLKSGYLVTVPIVQVSDNVRRFTWLFPQGIYSEAVEMDLINQLFYAESFEERWLAIRAYRSLNSRNDLVLFRQWLADCEGIADTDLIVRWLLTPAVLADPIYWLKRIRTWRTGTSKWEHRASVLSHLPVIQRGQIPGSCWTVMKELLEDPAWEVRQAVGWILRECLGKSPLEAQDFLEAHSSGIRGIVRKEACRSSAPRFQK